MNRWRIVFRSLRHYWRTNVFIVLGVVVATAVITGSLLVGDSMQSSLRQGVLERLGNVDDVLMTPHFFPSTLAARVAEQAAVKGKIQTAAAIITQGGARRADSDLAVGKVSLLGVDDNYWQLFPAGSTPHLNSSSAAINQALADDLHLQPGIEFLVSVDRSGMVTDDVLFAHRRREETLQILRLQVAAIVADKNGGGFGLQAGAGGATSPRNVFVARQTVAATLDQAGLANVVLAGESESGKANPAAVQSALAASCTLADYGLKLVPSNEGYCLGLESGALLFNPDQVASVQQAAAEIRASAVPTSVYLTTRVVNKVNKTEIAYAIIAAKPEGIHWNVTTGTDQNLDNSGVILNTWSAQDLSAKPGDDLDATYLIPTRAGNYLDSNIPLKVAGIVDLAGPAADRHMTPDLNGLTDAKRIEEWKLPFPVDHKRITDRDEDYWDKYAATPKLFVSPQTMRNIWSHAVGGMESGWATGIRITPPEGTSLEDLEKQIVPLLLKHLSPEKSQMFFRPVRDQLLASAAGSSDFGQLFLAMSFFLVFAAAALAGTLMRLLVEQRAGEVGVMLASGWRRRAVTWLLVREGLALTAIGVLLGVPAGVLYNAAILRGMNLWWMQPWGTQVLNAHVTGQSLAIGAATGLILGFISVIWGVRSLARTSLLRLISGRQSLALISGIRSRKAAIAAVVTSILGISLLAASATHAMPAEAGFFCGGASLLLAMIFAASASLSAILGRRKHVVTLPGLAMRNAAASRRRSVLTIGLLACASFILVAVAANRRDYSHLDTNDKQSGAGGFALSASTSVPLHFDLASAQGRKSLGISPQEERAFAGVTVMSLAESPGDDVSCLNLAKPTRPRLLGVTNELANWQGFPVEHVAATAEKNPWNSLFAAPDKDGAIPAIGDADSVQWILHAELGGTYEFEGPDGRPVKLKIVGLIPGSIFAGELLVSEGNLKRIYPKLSGTSRFLFALPKGTSAQSLTDALRTGLADQGVDVHTTREILNRYISVQNVYLSIFLSLGGLGLLLGTAGMIAVIARSVLERRGELGLMAAAGFRRSALIRLVTVEHIGLLAAGLLCGTAAALLAVLPALKSAHTDVQWGKLIAILSAVALVGIIVCMITARQSIDRNPMRALHEE